MTQQYKRNMARKHLRELPLYRSSLEYYRQLAKIQKLPLRKARDVRNRLLTVTNTVETMDRALSLLTDMERRIIDLHYAKEHPFEDITEIVHLERSSVYRYHTQALDKIAIVLYGA